MWGIVFPILLVTLISVARNSGVEYSARLQAASLIGFMVWKLCTGVLVAIPNMIESEANTVTLENVMVTAYISFFALLLFRIFARSVRSFLEVTLLGIILTVVWQIALPVSFTAVLITFLTLAGVWGVGLALAGLALLYKSVSSVTGLIAYLAFSISGAFIPINALGLTFTILKYVFPMTWGIDLLRQVMLDHYDLATLWQNGSLLGPTAQTSVMLFIGYLTFEYSLKRARVRGELGVY
jgi:ABC-2 type transport system permease protein